MSLPIGAPGVNVQEINLSTLTPSLTGVYGGLVIQATKGPVNTPQLVTSDSQLLSTFTPAGFIEVGYDLAYFAALAFLQKSSTLWVVRSNNGGEYGGASLKVANASVANLAWTQGYTDPEEYAFNSATPTPGVASVFTATSVDSGSHFDIAGSAANWTFQAAYGTRNTPVHFYVWYNVTDGTNVQQDPNIYPGNGIEVNILHADTAAEIATKTAAALLAYVYPGTLWPVVASASVVSAVITITLSVPAAVSSPADGTPASAFTFAVTNAGTNPVDADELFILFGSNVGAWNNQVAVEIVNYNTNPLLVGEVGAFAILVFANGNVSNPVETWICSRNPQAQDGYGNNIYIENVLVGSNYISAIDNVAIADTVTPMDQLNPLYLAYGSDGSAVTDSQQITASNALANENAYPLTVFMDAGWSTPAYQDNLNAIVSTRQDSVALLSVPYSAESAASYLNAIVNYRTATLDLDSSYAAMYTPHCLVYDSNNNRQIYVDPTGYAGAAISFSASNYEIWFPPAGYTRGVLSTILDVRIHFTDGDIAYLYNNGINPIKFSTSKGIAIWGQKTLAYRPSALNRLNVRLLLITIEPAIASALDNFVFEINDTQTQSLITSIITSYLNEVLANQGVYAFSVVCNATNNPPAVVDANQLVAAIYVQPTKSAEFITLQVVITSTGASVTST